MEGGASVQGWGVSFVWNMQSRDVEINQSQFMCFLRQRILRGHLELSGLARGVDFDRLANVAAVDVRIAR